MTGDDEEMARSFLTRFCGLLAAGALVGTALATASAAPASATNASCTTKTTLTINNKARSATSEWGDFGSVQAEVDLGSCTGGTAPSSVYADNDELVILRSLDRGKTWKPIARSTSTYASAYGSGYFKRNAIYGASYSGGTLSYASDTFAPSRSKALSVRVTRSVDFDYKSRRGAIDAKFAVTPKTGLVGKRLTVQVKRGGWKRYGKAKVNKRGVASVRLKGARKAVRYRIVLPAGKGFTGSWYGVRVYTY